MAKIFHLGNGGDPNITSGFKYLNSRNVYPITLSATSGGTTMSHVLILNYDFFNVAQTDGATNLLILPSAEVGTSIDLYAVSTFKVKAGADSSGLTINGGADTASITVTAGDVASLKKVSATNWVLDSGTEVSVSDGASLTVSTSQTLGNGSVQFADVSITNAEMLALRATPKTLVAAPGAGFMLDFIDAVIAFDYTGAYTESTDNMAVLWGAAGTACSEAIEATGFVDATADTMIRVAPATSAARAKAIVDNKALVLHNTGDGEFGGGNAANVVRVRVAYRILPLGW